jgi:ribonucleoside-diphosphate reductase alpha chain
VIAPTGTIGLVMDCDTTGIEPDFALVKFKKLAGGGYFKIINRAVPSALRRWATPKPRSPRSKPTPSATARWPGAGHQPRERSRPRASPKELEAVKAAGSAFDIKFVFNKWTLGEDFCTDVLGCRPEAGRLRAFDLLTFISASPRRTSRPPTSTSAVR